jgi:hypothetical protein
MDLSSCVRTGTAAASLARAIAAAPGLRYLRIGDSEDAYADEEGFCLLWQLQLGSADRAPLDVDFQSDDESVLTDEEEDEFDDDMADFDDEDEDEGGSDSDYGGDDDDEDGFGMFEHGYAGWDDEEEEGDDDDDAAADVW